MSIESLAGYNKNQKMHKITTFSNVCNTGKQNSYGPQKNQTKSQFNTNDSVWTYKLLQNSITFAFLLQQLVNLHANLQINR